MHTLAEDVRYFNDIFGRRNRIFLPGLRDRVDFLIMGIGDLQDAVRKGAYEKLVGEMLARVLARTFGIVNGFDSLDWIPLLCRKFPLDKCIACKNMPCTCKETRGSMDLEQAADREQMNWSLRDWCAHFDALYGPKNTKLGDENTLNRLFKEATEVLALTMEIPRMQCSLGKIEELFALEIADVFAWTIAMANILNINLHDALYNKYGTGCSHCGSMTCLCTHWSREPRRL